MRIPEGIYPAVPLYGQGPHSCLFGTREREEVKLGALRAVFCDAGNLDVDLWRRVASFLYNGPTPCPKRATSSVQETACLY